MPVLKIDVKENRDLDEVSIDAEDFPTITGAQVTFDFDSDGDPHAGAGPWLCTPDDR